MSETATERVHQEKPPEPVPWFKTEDELIAYIREMLAWPGGATDGGEGYGRCVHAMSNAALAAYRYIGGKLGVTGFQASCADMQFLVDSRGMKHGALLLDGNDVLYPQYDLVEKAREFVESLRNSADIRQAAAENLAKGRGVENVRAHWQAIVDAPVIPERES